MIVHVIASLTYGGAQNALYRLVTALPDPSVCHVVSLTDDGVFGPKLRAAGVEVTSLHMSRSRFSFTAFATLVRVLRTRRPSVVQTWMYHADLLGGLAAWIAGVPVCWGIRNGDVSVRNKVATRCVIRVCALLSRWIPSVIVCNSRRAAQVHRDIGYASPFVIVPNGLDLGIFTPRAEFRASTRRALGIPETARVVGHVGRKDTQKDHPTLMAAFDRLASVEVDSWLVLAGEGLSAGDPYLEQLLRQTAYAERVIALGQRDDVQDVMSSIDVFALSSVGEAFPNVLIEAMACGIPCVVTDAGDSADIVADTGWVVPPLDPVAMSVALREALNESPDQRASRRLRARRRVEDNYGIDRMVRAYSDIWNDAAAGALKPCAA